MKSLLLAAFESNIPARFGPTALAPPALVVWQKAQGANERLPNVIRSPRVASGVEAVAELVDRNTSAGIEVDAMTAFPRWDGEVVDYYLHTARDRQ